MNRCGFFPSLRSSAELALRLARRMYHDCMAFLTSEKRDWRPLVAPSAPPTLSALIFLRGSGSAMTAKSPSFHEAFRTAVCFVPTQDPHRLHGT